MSRGDVARRWRGRLDAALDDPADGAPVPTTEDLPAPPVSERIALHEASAACPRGAMAPDPQRFDASGSFVEATFTATREVALVALRNAAPANTPVEMVESALSRPEALRSGVADWIQRVDRAALATLRNSAVAWVTDAMAVGARRGMPEWCAPALLRHRVDDRGVTICAATDAVRRHQQVVHLLVMRPREGVTDRRVAGRVVLLWAIVHGEEVASVTLGMRDSFDRRRFEIDEVLREESVGDAVDDIRWAQRPSTAPLVPGAQCRYCVLLDQCPEGVAKVGSNRRYPFPAASAVGSDPTM